MDNIFNTNKLNRAEELISNINNENVTVKRIKNDKGLIEKTEASKNKVILVEDNKQIICG